MRTVQEADHIAEVLWALQEPMQRLLQLERDLVSQGEKDVLRGYVEVIEELRTWLALSADESVQ